MNSPLAALLCVLFLSGGAAVLAQDAADGSRARREAIENYEAGTRAMTAQRYREPAGEFERAVGLDPRLVLAHCGLCQARMALGGYPRASQRQLDWLRTLRQCGALEVDPKLGETHCDLADGLADAVGCYAAGGRAGAVAEVLGWTDARIAEAVREASRESLPVRAALLLLTDAAAGRREAGRSARPFEDAARELARHAIEGSSVEPALRDYVRRWYEAVALRAQSEARWDDALDWAERGRKAFPGSADLTQVVASIEELAASLPAEPAADDLLGETGNRYLRRQVAQAAQARQHLEHARRLLLVAAAAAPARVDLRLRLGRIAWRLGDLGSARSELQAALAGARSGSDACLANLFLGRVLEDEGRLTEAAGSYEAAVALAGQSQAARLALSYLRLRQGDETAALLELEAAIRPAGQRRTADPFWRYAWGFADRAEGLLEALRREASS